MQTTFVPFLPGGSERLEEEEDDVNVLEVEESVEGAVKLQGFHSPSNCAVQIEAS